MVRPARYLGGHEAPPRKRIIEVIKRVNRYDVTSKPGRSVGVRRRRDAARMIFCRSEGPSLVFLPVKKYIAVMEHEQKPFSGIVVRVEPDGFGIVEFDNKVGANTHGVFSTTIGSTVPFLRVKPGMHVSGIAEASDKDLAAVKTLELD
jgi:hypothetical protein